MPDYGIVLDFQYHENHIIIIRTGDDPPYKGSAIQLVSLDSFKEVKAIKKDEHHPGYMQKVRQGETFVYGTLDLHRIGNDFSYDSGEIRYISE